MTIGSQLRDLYIAELEKGSGPIVPVTAKMLENEHMQMLVAEAHASIEQKFTLAAFTVEVDKEDKSWLYAIHVYARALKGESIGGVGRPDGAQRKFLKLHAAFLPLLENRKFSSNPKMNEAKGVTTDLFLA